MLAGSPRIKDPDNTPTLSKSFTVPTPSDAEDKTLFFTPVAITVTKVTLVITGSTSVTAQLKHATDRSAAGTQILSQLVDSTTTGESITSFDDATIPADSFVWLETSALSGTPDSLAGTIQYTED